MTIRERFAHAWNAFRNRDPTEMPIPKGYQYATYYRPDTHKLRLSNEKSLMSTIFNRIAVDASLVDIRHVRVDKNGQYKEDIDTSYLSDCLKYSANIDQSARDFMRDAIISMFDEGVVCLVPVEADRDPNDTEGAFDVMSLRTGRITQWFPTQVQVNVYNERICQRQDILIDKSACAIIENPFYTIMNEPNSVLRRLVRKMALLDSVDEIAGSGKLDLIIQLPYSIKNKLKENEAKDRVKGIKDQLKDDTYGIAYIDGSEKVIQLNRAVDNNLLKQVEYLTSMLYNQLGLTQTVLDGTADEQTMLNYRNRTLEPILNAFVEEMRRKFLTKTARTQGQSIMYFSSPFKLVPVNNIADIADKFTRNEIMSSNEIRAIIGLKPSDQPGADELRNKNLNRQDNEVGPMAEEQEAVDAEADISLMDTPISRLKKL